MKKLLTFALVIATTVVGFAQRPILVGHRGSLYGVENSVESFANGAKLGYDYLETDFKVTKDLKLVCSHDDDISRLAADGSKLTIAASTLEELQKVPFAQTRGGVKYTGRLCSAQEYLDVCKEYDVKPLIELKWATGINSNDCSNIPMLIKFIEDNGFRNKCIILTSMKPCLEYIRKNYPDIELQFLTGQYWANHFDWCVEQGIDADIQAGYFDKSTVTKYHDAGLKVNMWTTNTNDGYLMYGNMSCDMITTDNLDPKNLPDLDPSVLFPPNTVDYPETSDGVKGNYTPEKVSEIAFPAALKGAKVNKAIIDGSEWIVLTGNNAITRVNVLSGEVAGTYNTTGIEKIGDIALTADGYLVASQATAAPFGKAEGNLVVFYWTSPSDVPAKLFTTETFSSDITRFVGGDEDATVGNSLAVSGRMNDLKVYTPAVSPDGVRILGFNIRTTGLQNITHSAKIPGVTGDVTLTVTTASRDNILVNSASMVPVEYFFDWNTPGSELKLVGSFPDGATSAKADGVSYTRLSTRPYALVPSCNENGAAYTGRLYNVKGGITEATAISPVLHAGSGTTAPAYATTGVSKIDGRVMLHFFVADDAIVSYSLYTSEENEAPQDINLVFEKVWVNANTTDNAPEHIDGTNAQQGTAVNGLFYVNDCDDKKIYVFDRTGCIGSMPGGEGLGTARDDKGNIIVRDDKLTGTTHSFIVYPAGATPENPGTPVTFTTEVKLDGQTNFISAGGDVLGAGGHIYLFPNKQSGINIIAVENGQPTGCEAVQGLKISGSTAGYVCPLNDNTENWLYQVRTVGIYMSNGGVNSEITTERYSTTAPARNSTGGCAMFKLRGHEILVHNSGANYKGGFTVKNLTNNKEVIASVAPIGKLGNESGGNNSAFNWLIPEKVSPGEYRIYQYCPANGMGVYTLRDLNYDGLEEITFDAGVADAAAVVLTADHNTLSVSGVENVTDVKVFSIAGVLVAHGCTDTVNITALTPGMYIATVNNTASAKFLKK